MNVFDVLNTVASAKDTIHSLYNSFMNSGVSSTLELEDGFLVVRCNKGRAKFLPDGIIEIQKGNDRPKWFDNHCYTWEHLSKAMQEALDL